MKITRQNFKINRKSTKILSDALGLSYEKWLGKLTVKERETFLAEKTFFPRSDDQKQDAAIYAFWKDRSSSIDILPSHFSITQKNTDGSDFEEKARFLLRCLKIEILRLLRDKDYEEAIREAYHLTRKPMPSDVSLFVFVESTK